ncbi:ubiquitin carboxyl-terminal hydrolase 36-like isoform X2 [Homarus americanus]|uniref:ubiquitin carboxyl-terminal hydrolase 36-like isoform X2 n=1 Tax=Homarus americanus TaxID=6706 RepID=UPI001C479D9A|nr:ubiquitin carboxyl-terminal hydrolase 36-like isoform X2 [Homarus americanus]
MVLVHTYKPCWSYMICPLCRHVSTTFSHFQDLVLDIRSVNSVDDALNLHFKKETLDVDNAYKCERCHKKVSATKRHLIEQAPHVLLIQLKRFTMSGGKIGKHISIQRTIDISRFVSGASKHQTGSGPYQYRLASMVIHLGGSQHGGHYTAVAEASSGTMFEYDDSSVRSISVQSALLRNPYILFYEMVRKPKELMQVKQVVRQSSEKALIRQNSDLVSKPIPTSHSASSVANGFGRATDNIGELGNRNGVQAPSNKPPLSTHKDRERISFGLKFSQGKSESTNSKPNKIILNPGTTSLLGSKSCVTNSGSSSSTSTSGKPSCAPKTVPSLVPYPDDSEDSEVDDSKRGSVKAHREKSVQNGKVKSDNQKVIKAVNAKSIKSERLNGSLHVQKPEKLSNGDIKNTESDSSVKSNSSSKNGSLTPFMPRSLQVVNNTSQHHSAGSSTSCKGKGESGWQVTEASLHSPSESSSSSAGGSHTNTFTVVDQPTSCKLEQKQQQGQVLEKPENQGWTVTIRRQRPELEKSLSHDSVLPSPVHKKDEPDSASLRSKASVDSCRSDRSTKSMKKSLLSLFTCVSSSHSPESPEDEQPEASHPQKETQDCNKHKSTDGDRTKINNTEDKTSKVNGTSSLPANRGSKKEISNDSNKNGIISHSENCHHSSKSDSDSETDNSQSKRFRDHDDNEPSSPSKKCCPEVKAKSSKRSEQEVSKNGLSPHTDTSKNGPSNCYEAKSKNVQCSDSDISKNGVIHENGKSKNGRAERGEKGSKSSKDQKQSKISSSNNGETIKTQNDSSSSVSASSLSGSSSDSESSDGEGDKEGTERWVEKTKETLGKARTNPSANVVFWNGNMRDLSHTLGRDHDNEQSRDRERENVREPQKRRSGMWDGSRTTDVVDELRRAGNYAYGTKVNTWGGGRSALDHEVEKDRREIKKRTSDDLYNEEFDSGRTKKMKTVKKSWESQRWDRDSGNDFQKVQDFRNSGSWTPHNHSPYQYTSPHFNNQHPRHSQWDKSRNNYQQRNKSWNRFGKRDHKFHKKHKERYKHWDRRD